MKVEGVYYLEELQGLFVKPLEIAKNKIKLITKEIEGIDEFVNKDLTKVTIGIGGRANTSYNGLGEHVFVVDWLLDKKLMKKVFYDFEVYEIVEDISKIKDTTKRKTVAQTYDLALYKIWLEGLLTEITNSSEEEKDTEEENKKLPHKQAMLVLYYLGIETNPNTNTNENYAQVISKILGFDYNNTRQYLSYVQSGDNDVRTKRNLNKVKDLFEEFGFSEIVNKIKIDISKLRK